MGVLEITFQFMGKCVKFSLIKHSKTSVRLFCKAMVGLAKLCIDYELTYHCNRAQLQIRDACLFLLLTYDYVLSHLFLIYVMLYANIKL